MILDLQLVLHQTPPGEDLTSPLRGTGAGSGLFPPAAGILGVSPQDSLGLLSDALEASRAPTSSLHVLPAQKPFGSGRHCGGGERTAPSPMLLSQAGSGVELPQPFSGRRRSGALSATVAEPGAGLVSVPGWPLCSTLLLLGGSGGPAPAPAPPAMSAHSGRPPGRSVQPPGSCQQRPGLSAPTSCPAASWRRAT